MTKTFRKLFHRNHSLCGPYLTSRHIFILSKKTELNVPDVIQVWDEILLKNSESIFG